MKDDSLSSAVGQALLCVLAVFVIITVSASVFEGFQETWMARRDDPLAAVIVYGVQLVDWVLLIGLCLTVKQYRGCLAMLSPRRRGNRPVMLLAGLGLGMGCNLLAFALATATGCVSVSFRVFEPGWLALIFLAVLIQSGAEELLMRMFLMTRLRQLFPKHAAVAILGNALAFALMHVFNNGMGLWSWITLILVGVEYSLLVYYFDSLWGAIVAHTTWNFTQNILLGLPNSGTATPYGVFAIQGTPTDGFAYSAAFGLEGCAAACLLLLAFCALLLFLGMRKQRAARA